MHKKTALSLVSLAAVIGMMAGTSRHLKFGTAAQTIRPLTTQEHALTSVKVLSKDRDEGGSGVIISSTSIGSNILTNKHVCELIQAGGWVENDKGEYRIQAYKIYPTHDLCLLNIGENLGVNTVIAKDAPEIYSDLRISGHPNLLPMIMSPGHFSGLQPVRLIIDTKPCKKADKAVLGSVCNLLGEIPVHRVYQAQVTSALIMPGSSGSGVFNKNGELSGLVFAGSSDLAFGDIVPWKFVKDFLDTAETFPWNYPDPGAHPKKFMKMIFRTMSICQRRQKILELCSDVDFPSIWKRKN